MDSLQPEPRYRTYAKVRCQKYGAGLVSLMVLKNISKSGAKLNMISIQQEFQKGDILRMVIELDTIGRSRTVNAQVVWSQSGALGVSFLHPDDVVSRLLNR